MFVSSYATIPTCGSASTPNCGTLSACQRVQNKPAKLPRRAAPRLLTQSRPQVADASLVHSLTVDYSPARTRRAGVRQENGNLPAQISILCYAEIWREFSRPSSPIGSQWIPEI